jgi:hypothetical protein
MQVLSANPAIVDAPIRPARGIPASAISTPRPGEPKPRLFRDPGGPGMPGLIGALLAELRYRRWELRRRDVGRDGMRQAYVCTSPNQLVGVSHAGEQLY